MAGSRSRHPFAWGVAAVLLGALLGGPVHALTLTPGDVVVADPDALVDAGLGTRDAAVIFVDPGDGSQTIVSSGGLLTDPTGIAVGTDHQIYVSNADALGGSVVRIDPDTGAQTLLTTGNLLAETGGLVLDGAGRIYVAEGSGGSFAGVVEVDPGGDLLLGDAQTSLIALPDALGIALEASGDLVVSDPAASVVRVDRTGVPVASVLATALLLSSPAGLDVDPVTGTIYVADTLADWLVAIDPGSGAQSVVSLGGLFLDPRDVAVDDTGTLVLVADSTSDAVVEVDPGSGIQSALSSASLFGAPRALAIVPIPEPASISLLALGLAGLLAARRPRP